MVCPAQVTHTELVDDFSILYLLIQGVSRMLLTEGPALWSCERYDFTSSF